MAKFEALIDDLGQFYSSVYNGAKRSAERVVDDLQQEGPLWTGRFSNSWQISEGRTQVAGSGQAGQPKPIKFPSAPKNRSRQFTKNDVVVFTISNFATGRQGPYALKAMDIEEGKYEYPGVEPLKEAKEGVRLSGIRGDLNLIDGGPNRRTAPLDWYTNYVDSGRIQRVIQTELSATVQRLA
jgi:hypothetical protein